MIAVLGSRGMLGLSLIRQAKTQGVELLTLNRKDFDILQSPIEDLENLLSKTKLQAVINAAAILKSDEQNGDMEQVNARFPHVLAEICGKFSLPLIHISTDGVFDGRKGMYLETDTPTAQDAYGKSKALGEPKNAMIIRCSIIGDEPAGRARSLLAQMKSRQGQFMDGFVNHQWNGMTSDTLSESLLKIVDQNLFEEKIFHLFSPTDMSKFDLLKSLNEVYGLQIKITPTEAPHPKDMRLRSNHTLSGLLLQKTLQEQLREMV